MNILYISNLSTNVAAGLNWSVPARIAAQAIIDNVFWINLTNVEMPHWKKVKAFHNIREFKKLELEYLPPPFNFPDVVVFEGFYHYQDPLFARKLYKKGIPYIIVPRGSLTRQAQRSSFWKYLKKMIANKILFEQYTRRAVAIQYLTTSEGADSGPHWCRTSFIVSNGFSTPALTKSTFSQIGIKAIFIGRLDMYHKGLDILLEACHKIQSQLIQAGFTLDIYGPQRYDYDKIDRYIASKHLTNVINLKGEISGEAKKRVLLNSDIFILTSRFEGHPMGLIEALAYGLPVLVSPGTNMADVIEEAKAGWSCNQTSESICCNLLKIISEKDFLSIKSEAAKQLALKYNWHTIASQFHDEVAKLILE